MRVRLPEGPLANGSAHLRADLCTGARRCRSPWRQCNEDAHVYVCVCVCACVSVYVRMCDVRVATRS